jgi:hypothetical protein
MAMCLALMHTRRGRWMLNLIKSSRALTHGRRIRGMVSARIFYTPGCADVFSAPVDEGHVPTESSRSPSPVDLTTAEQTQAKNDWDPEVVDAEVEDAGDDFDDFEEGGGAGDEDDDFGDFDEGISTAQPEEDPISFKAVDTTIAASIPPSLVSNQVLDRNRCFKAISLRVPLFITSSPLSMTSFFPEQDSR